MRTTASMWVVLSAILVTAADASAQQRRTGLFGPYTPQEATQLAAVWDTIRGAERYQDINWRALGLAQEPGSEEARRQMSDNWDELRGAARFGDIDWAATLELGGARESSESFADSDRAPESEPRQSVATDSPMDADPAPDSIAGRWVGLFHRYPSIVEMTLEIAEPDGDGVATGELRMESADSGGGFAGFTTIRVDYDRQAYTADITLGPEAVQLRMNRIEFRGYLNTNEGTIAGIMTNAPDSSSPFFVLARPRDASAVFDTIELDPGGGNGLLGGLGLNRRGYDRDVLYRWAQRFVDEYPDVDAYRTQGGQSFTMVRNLFDDAHFSAHFGDTYDRMSDRERNRILNELREIPAPRSNLPEERVAGVLRTVQRAFMPTGTFAAPDAVFSTVAMRHLTGWRRGAMGRLESLDDSIDAFSTATAISAAGNWLTDFGWPSNRDSFIAVAEENLGRIAGKPLEDEVNRILANASGIEGARAINDVLSIRVSAPTIPINGPQSVGLAELATWAPDTWQALQPRLNTSLDALLTEYVAQARVDSGLTMGASASPSERLTTSKAWYDANGADVARFSRRAPMAEFLSDLGTHREAAFGAAMPALSAELASLAPADEVQRFGYNLYINPDSTSSPTWQRIEQLRRQRLAELAREAELARIGEGPFGPGDPGAAYLNALYRYDLARVAEEDRAVVVPLVNTLLQIMDDSGMTEFFNLLSGSVAPNVNMRALIATEGRRYSLTAPLAGFFITAYERVYPDCMEANRVRFTQTTTWTTVVRNGFGAELYRYPSGSSTSEFIVNQRHADAFRRVGATSSSGPEVIDLTTSLFGVFLPPELTDTMRVVSENLRGLRVAMTQYECDSDVITRIERALIDKVMSN